MATPTVKEFVPKVSEGDTQELEVGILSYLFTDFIYCAKFLPLLRAEHFSSLVYKNLFVILNEFYESSKKQPTENEIRALLLRRYFDGSQREILEKLLEAVTDAYSTDKKLEKQYAYSITTKFVQKAAIYSELVRANNDWKNISIEEIQNKINSLADLKVLPDDIGVSSSDFITHLIEREEDEAGLQTGFTFFDKAVRGGFRPGELSIILAPTNRGKTAVLVNLGRGLLSAGYRVVHYSLEMNYESMIDRYISSLTNIRINDLTSIDLRELATILQNYSIYTQKDVIVKYYSPHTVSTVDLDAHLQQLTIDENKKVDAVILDYADLLKPVRVYKEKRHELGAIHVELKQLGDKYGIPIITASQTNRAGELLDYSKNPGTLKGVKSLSVAHIAEDWSKAGIADYIFGLRAPIPYSKLTHEEQLLIMDVLKSRFSKRGEKILFKMNFSRCRMEDVDPDSISFEDIENELEQAQNTVTFEDL